MAVDGDGTDLDAALEALMLEFEVAAELPVVLPSCDSQLALLPPQRSSRIAASQPPAASLDWLGDQGLLLGESAGSQQRGFYFDKSPKVWLSWSMVSPPFAPYAPFESHQL